MNFYLPTKIITGKDCVKANAVLFKNFGSRCLIVTGKTSAKKCGALNDVTQALDSVGVTYEIFDKITQNPHICDCMEGGKVARETCAEFIIGIGGGSPLDAAKAVAVFATNDIGENDLYAMNLQNKPLKVIAVGTTAGTGSEVTQVSVITSSDGLKKSFRADCSFPALCLGDATYTSFMPDTVMRSTATDALSHCIESYFCKTSNAVSRMFALEGAKNIIKIFKKLDRCENLDFCNREELYIASLYGGIAISVTGTAFPHALGYFLTEDYGVAHGTACAVYLPEFIRYNIENASEVAKDFFEGVGTDSKTLIALIEKTAPKTDISLSEQKAKQLYPRWINNKCISKMYGQMSADKLQDIVIKCIVNGQNL